MSWALLITDLGVLLAFSSAEASPGPQCQVGLCRERCCASPLDGNCPVQVVSCLSSVAWIAASAVAAAAFAFGMLLLPDFFVTCYVAENFMKFSASALPVVGYFHIENIYCRRL